jgi:thiazole synthase
VKMAAAFAMAVQAGRDAFEAGLGEQREQATASSPVGGLDFLR